MTVTRELTQGPWQTSAYYQQAKKASEEDHPSLQFIKERYRGKSILEVACGEGTKLSRLEAKKRTGLDISKVAIKQAKRKLTHAIVGDAEHLPFKDGEFDATLSFFSLEHFEHPESVINEMIRVTKRVGELVILAPNFGAPNRASPCFRGSRIGKLVLGFLRDLFPSPSTSLHFHPVSPRSSIEAHHQDYDTVVEPYLNTLTRYLRHHKLELVHASSNWQLDSPDASALQRFFRLLGNIGLPPFKHWGPHLFVIAKKL